MSFYETELFLRLTFLYIFLLLILFYLINPYRNKLIFQKDLQLFQQVNVFLIVWWIQFGGRSNKFRSHGHPHSIQNPTISLSD